MSVTSRRLALKGVEPRAPTWGLLVGVGVLDILFGSFVLLGIERGSITPDISPGFSLDYIDWSHSLLMSAVWSVLFALVLLRRGTRVAVIRGSRSSGPARRPEARGDDGADRRRQRDAGRRRDLRGRLRCRSGPAGPGAAPTRSRVTIVGLGMAWRGRPRRRLGPLLMLVLAGCRPAGESRGAPPADASPYVGEQARSVKALSAERVRGLLEGEGLGYALAAELNGYPGPRHVLDLAGSLGLTAEQRARVEAIFRAMRDEVRAAGRELVRTEEELDRLFAMDQATSERVETLTREAARLEGRVRYAHLAAHVRTKDVLTAEQVEAYMRLRGYDARETHRHEPEHDGG